MIPGGPMPATVARLDAGHKPWMLPREADLRLQLINLPVAYGPQTDGVPYSFAALPGRYLVELLECGRSAGHKGPLVLLNPAYNVPSDAMWAALSELEDGDYDSAAGPKDEIWLLVDLSQRLVAYVFPGNIADSDLPLFDLRFLSCTDAALDALLLQTLGLNAKVRRLRLPPALQFLPALPQFPGMTVLAGLVAQKRLAMLQAGHRQTWAVITHHAGDVLLALKAVVQCGAAIDGIVVHDAYADIAREICPDMPIILIDGPLPARDAVSSPSHPLNEELLYLERIVLPSLPEAASFIFLRPVRSYIEATFTLAAQVAFMLGDAQDMRFYPQGSTLSGPSETGVMVPERLPRIDGNRLLLHFDGGWPLKIYPFEWQQSLIALLQEKGFSVSVLGPEGHNVPTYDFKSLAAFNELLSSCDALIGMDSFPCHYASQQRGLPTICLFASTALKNLAHAAPNYLAVEEGLSCSPCGSRTLCPRFGGVACRNFARPEKVADLIEECVVKI